MGTGVLTHTVIVKRSDCTLVYGSTTKGDVVKRSDCILVYGSTTKGDVVKRSDCILVHGNTTKGDVVKRSDCITTHLGKLFNGYNLQHVYLCMCCMYLLLWYADICIYVCIL